MMNFKKLSVRAVQYYRSATDQDIIDDAIEVANTITHILLGALIEPDRNAEQWTRARIRELLAGGELRRIRTVDILMNAQRKDSACEWLRFYFNKLQLTKAPDGGHLHAGKIVEIDYNAPVARNL